MLSRQAVTTITTAAAVVSFLANGDDDQDEAELANGPRNSATMS